MFGCLLRTSIRAFVVLAIGSQWPVPLEFAFLDRAVLRVPKASDIHTFVQHKQDELQEAWAAETEAAALHREHMRRRRELYAKLQLYYEAPQETEMESGDQQDTETLQGSRDAEVHADGASSGVSTDNSGGSLQHVTDGDSEYSSDFFFPSASAGDDQQEAVFILDPFEEYILRFNYTEVGDPKSYAEALAAELQGVPLSMSIRCEYQLVRDSQTKLHAADIVLYVCMHCCVGLCSFRGETHRVALMILSEPPEVEADVGPTWARLDKLIHVVLGVSMIVALLCCLCMWRLMHLLKHR